MGWRESSRTWIMAGLVGQIHNLEFSISVLGSHPEAFLPSTLRVTFFKKLKFPLFGFLLQHSAHLLRNTKTFASKSIFKSDSSGKRTELK